MSRSALLTIRHGNTVTSVHDTLLATRWFDKLAEATFKAPCVEVPPVPLPCEDGIKPRRRRRRRAGDDTSRAAVTTRSATDGSRSSEPSHPAFSVVDDSSSAPTSTASSAPVTSESEVPAVANHDLQTANHDLNPSTAPSSSEYEDTHEGAADQGIRSRDEVHVHCPGHQPAAFGAASGRVLGSGPQAVSFPRDAEHGQPGPRATQVVSHDITALESDDHGRQLRELRESHAKLVHGRSKYLADLADLGPNDPSIDPSIRILSAIDQTIKQAEDEIAARMQRNL